MTHMVIRMISGCEDCQETHQMLGEYQDENVRLRGVLHQNLHSLLALREQFPHNELLKRCIADSRLALAD